MKVELKELILEADAQVERIDRGHQIAAARRELEMRKRVYPRWVEQGKMQRKEAVWELAAIMAIINRLEGKLL